LAKAVISNKKIEKVSFLPVVINGQAQPELMPRGDKRSDGVCEYIEWACRDQNLNTKFSREGDELVVTS
jgi:hypothetical protein